MSRFFLGTFGAAHLGDALCASPLPRMLVERRGCKVHIEDTPNYRNVFKGIVVALIVIHTAHFGCSSERDDGQRFDLSGCTKEQVLRFVGELDASVQHKDFRVIAESVIYPLDLYKSGTVVHTIKNKAEFEESAAILFDATVAGAIRHTVISQELFANGEGVMLGGGEIWLRCIDGHGVRIAAINPSNDSLHAIAGELPSK